RSISRRTASASSRSWSDVDPSTSAKTIVTTLRAIASAGGGPASGAPHASQNRASAGSALPQLAQVIPASGCRPADALRAAGAAASSAVEEGAGSVQGRALDREETELRRDAAPGGEPAELPARGDDAMTRHDDGERIPSERTSDVTGRIARAETGRDLAVRERGRRGNRTRHLVHTAVEVRHARHVERDAGQIHRLSAEQRTDAVEDHLHVGRRGRFAHARNEAQDACASGTLAPLGQLDGDQTLGAPCDAALADRRIEQRELVCRHVRDPATTGAAGLGEYWHPPLVSTKISPAPALLAPVPSRNPPDAGDRMHTASERRPRLPEQPIDRLIGPLERFMHVEAAAGIVLLACTAIALVLA